MNCINYINMSDLEKLFNYKEKTNIQLLLNIVSLILYENEHNEDIILLYDNLSLESFNLVLKSIGGRTVTLPDANSFKDTLIFAYCYYLKEVLNMKWEDIKKIFPEDVINTKSYGKRIKKINSLIREKMNKLYSEVK